MFKKILILFLAFIPSISFSQDVVNSIPLALKGDRDVFQIVDNNKKEVVLFLSDKKKVSALRLNEQVQIVDSLSSNRPEKNYSSMIGYISTGNQYKLFWASENSREIVSQSYDFESRKVSVKNFNSELKNERVLQKFSDNGNFYIVTVLKNTNSLKFYIFNSSDIVTEKIIDLEGYKFYLSDFKKSNLYGVLNENLLPFESAFSLQQITPENPTSLTFSSKKRKCYIKDGTFTISFDTNADYTQLININLANFSSTEKIYKKAFIAPQPYMNVTSNSFLFDGKLFQFKLFYGEMVFTIKDLEDNILKEFRTVTGNDIEFKNSPILQENGSSSSQRVLGKTTQFLRKVSESNCGVSCYSVNGNYLLKFGSVSEMQQTSGAMIAGGAMFGITGALIAAAFSNPTFENFNSYASRKVVYFNSLFNINNNHIKGDIQPIAFDKIQGYIEENDDFNSPTVFKFNSVYYFGNYIKKTKQYELRKFVD